MDMIPYIGRARLTCQLAECLDRNKTRMDAECFRCTECTTEIVDLDGKVLAEIPLGAGKGHVQRAPTVDPNIESEPQAAVTPRPNTVGATGGRPDQKEK